MADSAAFGSWLRQRRKALDLSRQDLAGRVACAVVTIEKIEAGERRPSRQVAAALAAALRIPESERDAFVAFARGQAATLDGATAAAPPLVPNNVPTPLPPAIGRDEELLAIHDLLSSSRNRIVTLTGPGGVGKTLLAAHAALRCARTGHDAMGANGDGAGLDGVAFVNLAPVEDAGRVMTAIAQSVSEVDGAPMTDASSAALTEHLRDRSMLVVLDNVEQVSAAAPRVAELVAACPRLRLLLTSRIALALSGSRELAVSPLPHASAVALFLSRAKEADPGFAPTDASMPAIDALCRSLDGLPLAIELVAARVKLMSPQAILARLTAGGDRLRLGLVADGISELPARQRTMRSTIAWSYDLLTAGEQTMFRCLSIFSGGCDVRAAEAVLADAAAADAGSISCWNALSLLLNKSLLKREMVAGVEGDEPRFTMLRTVREFAFEQLRASAVDAEAVARRHAHHFLDLALAAEPHLNGPQPAAWLRMLGRDHDNLRAALQWHMAHDAAAALRMCAALGPFWYTAGLYGEGRACLEAALAAAGQQAPRASRAGASYWLGRIARRLNAWADALHYGEESVAQFRAVDDARSLAPALLALGWAMYSHVGRQQAARHFEEALALYQRLGDQRGIAQALLDLAHIVVEHDADYDRAARYLAESRAKFRQVGDDEGLALVHTAMGNIASLRGEYALCRIHLLAGLDGFKRVGAKGFIAGQYLDLGEVSYLLGDMAAAEEELLTSLQMHRELGSRGGVARSQYYLGRLRRMQGRLHEALDQLLDSLAAFRQFERTTMLARCVAAIAGVAVDRKQPELAAKLLGAAQRYFDSLPPFLAPGDIAEYDRDIAACRGQLGAATFQHMWAVGQAMSLDQACESALAI